MEKTESDRFRINEGGIGDAKRSHYDYEECDECRRTKSATENEKKLRGDKQRYKRVKKKKK